MKSSSCLDFLIMIPTHEASYALIANRHNRLFANKTPRKPVPGRLAPRPGFEPVTSRLTAGCSQKHRSVDVKQPRKPFRVDNNCESTKKLFGHNCTEPVSQCFRAALYHIKQCNSNFNINCVARYTCASEDSLHNILNHVDHTGDFIDQLG